MKAPRSVPVWPEESEPESSDPSQVEGGCFLGFFFSAGSVGTDSCPEGSVVAWGCTGFGDKVGCTKESINTPAALARINRQRPFGLSGSRYVSRRWRMLSVLSMSLTEVGYRPNRR